VDVAYAMEIFCDIPGMAVTYTVKVCMCFSTHAIDNGRVNGRDITHERRCTTKEVKYNCVAIITMGMKVRI
jgi:hypothetical protein